MTVLAQDLKEQLADRLGPRVRFDVPMAEYTSLRVGGPADALVMPEDRAELMEFMELIVRTGVPWFVIGGGTNLLVKDGGIRGVVICLRRGFDRIRILEQGRDKAIVEAGAGARLSALCRYAAEQNLEGMAFAVGIPGSVGGALIMNAGTGQGDMESVLTDIDVLLAPDQVVTLKKDRLAFGYRAMSLEPAVKHKARAALVLAGRFALVPASGKNLAAESRDLLDRRWKTQPKGFSAGCVFKNPSVQMPAGRLIDEAGGKGLQIGDARISDVHANFIINENRAAASDVLQLMEMIRDRVEKRFQIQLEPEIRIVGE